MYSVRRKQQMLKIRLMGTKSDIRWFQNFLQIDSDIENYQISIRIKEQIDIIDHMQK